jgi:predicted transcriptional regulator
MLGIRVGIGKLGNRVEVTAVDELSSRFLAAFNEIEAWMRNELDAKDTQDFAQLVRRMARKNRLVSRCSSELKRFARLRNLITHNYSLDKPLAIPSTYSVERLENLAQLLPSPPLLLSFAARPVEQCRSTDPLGRCVKKMYAGSFSQLPIFDDGSYLGLLTTETIARWLATFLTGDGKGMVHEQTVAEVMTHEEDREHVAFLRRTATVTQGLATFDHFQSRGKRLDAILITNQGVPTEPLLGIVTIYDIPRLTQASYG